MEQVRKSCGLTNGIGVDPDGLKGGLCLAWRGDVSITLQNFSKRHIDVFIDDHNDGKQWRFIGFYSSPYAQDRDESWNLLKNLWSNEELPWFVCEDFNEIMYGFEKREGYLEMKEEWKYFERGNLLKTNIQERLDRGVANENWMSMFPEATIKHLVHSISDHCPLLITTKKEDNMRSWKTFKFEAWWVLEESFEVEVKLIWETTSGDLLQKLDYLRKGLERWAVCICQSRKQKKEFLTSKLSKLMEAERSDNNLAELLDTKL
ncbi:endonuclease/exonuclease/phosphatase family protein [Gossypium australe]|uniref:Endonuclease/exonuclease/phosphatase family protein n=1 Tax=Gossypium australe TaxID=47621 RepID=A0A5B6W6C5_9ROSI|nr:endonuclease/exonuclease/phosphatase family protein [Gossypium australe]